MHGVSILIENPRYAALTVLLAAVATILGAFVFQHGFGYEPCALCYQQRIPYYVGMPVALASSFLAATGRTALAGTGLALLAVIFLASAGLGAYHAGVEWNLWEGPADCAAAGNTSSSHGSFLGRLESIQVVSCTDAAWRFLGLSLAGWNTLVSAALAIVAAMAAKRALTGVRKAEKR